MEVIEAMERLRPFGYRYVNIDDGWQAPYRAANGSLLADPSKFPHGIAYLADQAHQRGLLLGIYSARGNMSCQNHPGSIGHYEIDAQTFATWGGEREHCPAHETHSSVGSLWQWII